MDVEEDEILSNYLAGLETRINVGHKRDIFIEREVSESGVIFIKFSCEETGRDIKLTLRSFLRLETWESYLKDVAKNHKSGQVKKFHVNLGGRNWLVYKPEFSCAMLWSYYVPKHNADKICFFGDNFEHLFASKFEGVSFRLPEIQNLVNVFGSPIRKLFPELDTTDEFCSCLNGNQENHHSCLQCNYYTAGRF